MNSCRTSPPRFLLVKMSALGDIILSLNVARYLKQRIPECVITWVVETRFQELVNASPYIDNVLPLDTKLLKKAPLKFFSRLHAFKRDLQKSCYDVVFDLQGNCKSGLVTFLARGKDKVGWGKTSVAEWPNLLVTRTHIETDSSLTRGEQYLAFVKKYVQDSSEQNHSPHLLQPAESMDIGDAPIKIMVCPGSNWQNKQLSEKTWIEFLTALEKQYHPLFIFIWGNQQEQVFAQRLASKVSCGIIKGALAWPSWQALMLQMQCVISVDSCALHLAGLAGVPTFSIYGPSSSQIYKPSGKQHIAYQGGCPYGETFVKRCRLLRTCTTGACIKEISVEALMESFNRLAHIIALKSNG